MKRIDRCDERLKEQYQEVEGQFLPIIRSRARRLRWVGHVDIEDAVQEGRMALLSTMAHGSFDPLKGTAEAFISKVMENTFNSMLTGMLARSRTPWVKVWDGTKWKPTPMRPESLEDLGDGHLHSAATTPEEELIEREQERALSTFRDRLVERLEGEERTLFELKVQPPPELEGASNLMLARYIGRDKNRVDWLLYKIRLKFLELAGEFSEIWGTQEKSNIAGRPLIHISWKWKDDEFVRNSVIKRALAVGKRRWLKMESEKAKLLVQHHPWGAIIIGRRNEEAFTAVVEGKFSPIPGEVAGTGSMRVRLPVPWYGLMVRELRLTKASKGEAEA